MPIHAALNHKTIYNYDRKVVLSPQTIRLRPAAHTRTNILSYSLKISPENHFINWQQDPLGNYMARVVFPEPVDHFHVEVDLVAEMAVLNPFDFFLEDYAEEFPFSYVADEADSLEPYLDPASAGPLLQGLIDGIDRTPRRTVDFLFEMNQLLQKRIGYVVRMEPGVQTPEETLGLSKGSCRDTAWLMVQLLRHMGLAARFASGYLIQLRPDQKPLEGPTGPESDFTDLHAWAEVYLPGAGWIGLDATSGLLAGEGHIPLACAPAPTSAAPISGLVGPAKVEFSHEMQVTRIYESPRVTKPFSDDSWSKVDALGQEIEDRLIAADVRLTMGGEPTFVSVDDMDGEEWNTDALGPTKRKLAFELVKRVRQRFAPEGLLTFGQGKQYPGEPLPRWAFGLFWRNDGQPLWNRADLIADEDEDYKPTVADAETFIHLMCDRLGVDRRYAVAAFEDPLVHLKAEQQLPINLDPKDPAFAKDQDRKRLADILRRGLDQPKGYVLPVMRGHDKAGEHWITGPWEFKAGYMFLLPGDSPVGFRLPLAALPYLPPERYPSTTPVDPYSIEGALPDAAVLTERFRDTSEPVTASADPGSASPRKAETSGKARVGPGGNVSDVVRTAMVVEPRAGRLNVFMPPTICAEDYLELIAAAESAAAVMNMPIHIEGYEPPPDPRISVIRVTPDPGVIEVNVHPATDWAMLRDITKGLYDDARQTRLGTEKFMVDGRHIGTGGGNHIVVGGATPADSPFLRRPDLLGSLIRYWQNHPSLSYLFSGMFIGPTSQAPRVDEARDDTLYELEIALSQLPKRGEEARPWTVDRMLRNLLIDLTGNTHRSEICIDKLYSPSGPTGRLGLVEFRAFEMPPHAEMSLAQQLLLRGLIARFWDQPYTRPLVRHGDALRDRHMLPYYAWQDFECVIAEMQEAGFAFDADWYRAQFEFRFPRMGEASYHGMEIQIRNALEPWHVLGEESGSSGTARYVDSSLERLQVQVSGLSDPERYMIACNGRHVPLAPTTHAGTWVAGVRYKAWAPYSALHPMIDIHTPLVFDLIDTWSGRAIGGCRYHVVHPGGRNYEISPVNGEEAEGRRLSRFEPRGHSPGPVGVPDRERNPRFPHTLDLRAPVMPA